MADGRHCSASKSYQKSTSYRTDGEEDNLTLEPQEIIPARSPHESSTISISHRVYNKLIKSFLRATRRKANMTITASKDTLWTFSDRPRSWCTETLEYLDTGQL